MVFMGLDCWSVGWITLVHIYMFYEESGYLLVYEYRCIY